MRIDFKRLNFSVLNITFLLFILMILPISSLGQSAQTTPDPEIEKRKAEADTKIKEADAKIKEADAKKAELDIKTKELEIQKAEIGANAEAQKAELDIKNKEIANQKAEADARKAEADAETAETTTRKDQIANRKAEVDLLTGSTTTKGELIENKLSASKALVCAAEQINKRINLKKEAIELLIVYSVSTSNAIPEYLTLLIQLKTIEENYKSTFGKVKTLQEKINSEDGAGIAAGVIADIASLAIDWLALFKTDVAVEGVAITLSKESLIAAYAGQTEIPVYYPERITPLTLSNSDLVKKINDLNKNNAQARNLITALTELQRDQIEKKKELTEEKNALEKTVKDKEELLKKATGQDKINLEREINELKAGILSKEGKIKQKEENENATGELLKELTTLNTLYETTLAKLIAIPAENNGGSAVSLMTRYLRAESLLALLNSDGAKEKRYWIDLDVKSGGGNTKVKTNPIVDIFTGGQRLSFSGGVTADFNVFNSAGRLLTSGSVPIYIPYQRSEKISTTGCPVPKSND